MQCGAWVRLKKKVSSPYNLVHARFFKDLEHIGHAWGSMNTGHWPSRSCIKRADKVGAALLAEYAEGGFKQCEGRIVCSIEPHEEPVYGGICATVEILFECDTCKNNYFPSLSDDTDVVAGWVTDHIASLPDVEV
jgi:hypothetical protein